MCASALLVSHVASAQQPAEHEPCQPPFFAAYRAFCPIAGELARAELTDERERAAVTELGAFCEGKGLPSVAEAGPRARGELLGRLRTIATRTRLPTNQQVASMLVGLEALVPTPRALDRFEGPLATEGAREILRLACLDGGPRTWLPRTCAVDAGSLGPRPLATLYRALLRDLLELPARFSRPDAVDSAGPARFAELLALIGSLTTPDALVAKLTRASDGKEGCTSGLPAGTPRALSWREATGLALARWIDDRTQGLTSAEAMARGLGAVRREATDAGWTWPGAELAGAAAEQKVALERLSADLAAWESLRARVSLGQPFTRDELRALLTVALATLFESAKLAMPEWHADVGTSAAGLDVVPLDAWPSGAPGLQTAQAMLAWSDLLISPPSRGMSRLITVLPAVPTPEAWRELLDWAGELAATETEDEARAIVTRRLKRAVLGPWSEPWLLDGNLSVPSLANNNVNLYGDALLGYAARSWGVTVRGALQRLDRRTETKQDYIDATSGGLEGWWRLPGDRLRIELRGAVAAGDTLTVASQTSGANLYVWEDQSYVRGSLLAAVVYQGHPTFAGGVWLGAGYQSDGLERRAIPNVALPNQTENLFLVDSRANAYLNYEGRLRGEWRVVPGTLALRLRADGRHSSVTRDAYTEVSFTGVKISGTRSRSYDQDELAARAFIDVIVAEFLGFTPSVHAGVDAWLYSGDTELPNLVIPVLGAGIKREAW